MKWEELNAKEFTAAVKDTGGTCIIPVGSLERHGDHMPLGTDYLMVHKAACIAAEKEPAVVFPGYFFGQVCESMANPGAIVLKPELLIQLLYNVYEEIARNGFTKIIVLNGHGGNWPFLQFMGFMDMRKPKDYCVYYKNWIAHTERQMKEVSKDQEGRPGGHACEWEASLALYLLGDLVKLENAPVETQPYLNRRNGIEKLAFTGVDWFAACPECYVGNAKKASLERGEKYFQMLIESVVQLIAAVKTDEDTPALQNEFFRLSHGAK